LGMGQAREGSPGLKASSATPNNYPLQTSLPKHTVSSDADSSVINRKPFKVEEIKRKYRVEPRSI